jgi:hypothetical protein
MASTVINFPRVIPAAAATYTSTADICHTRRPVVVSTAAQGTSLVQIGHITSCSLQYGVTKMHIMFGSGTLPCRHLLASRGRNDWRVIEMRSCWKKLLQSVTIHGYMMIPGKGKAQL